jgi:hypothetical protein
VVAGPDSFGPNARGLEMAIDPQDRVMVLEPGTTTVKIFAANPTGAS